MTNGWCIPCVHHHLDPSVIVRSISDSTAPPQDIGGVGNTMTRMCAVGETVGRRMFRGEVVPRLIHTMFGCMIGESGMTTPCRSLRFLEQTNRWCSLVSWVLAVHHDSFPFDSSPVFVHYMMICGATLGGDTSRSGQGGGTMRPAHGFPALASPWHRSPRPIPARYPGSIRVRAR
jgi:hypothetical protein